MIGRRPAAVVLLGLLPLLAACGATDGQPLARGRLDPEMLTTGFTQRLAAGDPEEQAIVLTQTVYPATREENAVGAIILTRPDEREAFTAMQRVTHMPVNAPLLYTSADGSSLSEATLEEMKRLRPDGVMQDGQVQVYVVGDVAPAVAETVRLELRYRVRTLRAPDLPSLADLLDRWQAALKSDHPDEVLICAVDHPDGVAHGIGAMGWNAHMGRGFAWVESGRVPEATHRILERRLGGAYIYLTGPPEVISDEVAQELSRHGPVRRISGPTPAASNAVNAGYKDFGRNWGWWWSTAPRMFGWGIAQAGHNFIIGSADDMLGMIPAAVLGHMGKHGPILLVERDRVPRETADYLRMVQPGPPSPDQTILNFAWVIGDQERVSWGVQRELTRLLAPAGAYPGAPAGEAPQEPTAGAAVDAPEGGSGAADD